MVERYFHQGNVEALRAAMDVQKPQAAERALETPTTPSSNAIMPYPVKHMNIPSNNEMMSIPAMQMNIPSKDVMKQTPVKQMNIPSNNEMMPTPVKQMNIPSKDGMMPTTVKQMNSPEAPMSDILPQASKPNLPVNDIDSCSFKNGELPSCAPLAAGYVPYQKKNPPKYGNAEALTRGTLFPGLDLPFMNIANKGNPYAGTPQGDMMAICFAINELNLYLDTHKNDEEAFEMLKSLLKLEKAGREKYLSMYGPMTVNDLGNFDKYTWLKEPWPWEYPERMEK